MKNRSIAKEIEAAALLVTEHIARRILVVRGQKVMLDADLAALYGVQTRRLNEQVRRNAERFPEDFVFQPPPAESAILKSPFATSTSLLRTSLLGFPRHLSQHVGGFVIARWRTRPTASTSSSGATWTNGSGANCSPRS